jgi:hypothetical protein
LARSSGRSFAVTVSVRIAVAVRVAVAAAAVAVQVAGGVEPLEPLVSFGGGQLVLVDDSCLHRLRQDLPRVLVDAHHVGLRHGQGRQVMQPRIEIGVGKVGGKLALEPAVESDGDDLVDLAWPRPEGEPVEQMSGRLALGETRLLPGQAQRRSVRLGHRALPGPGQSAGQSCRGQDGHRPGRRRARCSHTSSERAGREADPARGLEPPARCKPALILRQKPARGHPGVTAA